MELQNIPTGADDEWVEMSWLATVAILIGLMALPFPHNQHAGAHGLSRWMRYGIAFVATWALTAGMAVVVQAKF